MRSRLLWVSGLIAVILLAATGGRGDTVTPDVPLPPRIIPVTSLADLGANDWTKWSQLETVVGVNFNAKSAAGVKITGTFVGGHAGGLTAVVCPPPPAPFPFACSWTGGNGGKTPFAARDTLLWTFDGASSNGPLSLAFDKNVQGAGLLIQSEFPGPFTAQIEAFKGLTLLARFPEPSDPNGDPEFIGVFDERGVDVTKIVLSITACTSCDASDFKDFAVDTLYSTGGPATPEPASVFLVGTALAGLAWNRLRRQSASRS